MIRLGSTLIVQARTNQECVASCDQYILAGEHYLMLNSHFRQPATRKWLEYGNRRLHFECAEAYYRRLVEKDATRERGKAGRPRMEMDDETRVRRTRLLKYISDARRTLLESTLETGKPSGKALRRMGELIKELYPEDFNEKSAAAHEMALFDRTGGDKYAIVVEYLNIKYPAHMRLVLTQYWPNYSEGKIKPSDNPHKAGRLLEQLGYWEMGKEFEAVIWQDQRPASLKQYIEMTQKEINNDN